MRNIDDRVSISIEAGVADVRLIRAEKMNALDFKMFEALVTASEQLTNHHGLRAAVLSGDGRGFCAGIDMSALQAFESSAERNRILDRNHGDANIFQHAVLAWRALPVPVIAAVHGVAFGGGFQLMLGADIRFIQPETKLSVMEIRWGLVPDMAGTILMRNLARDDVVRDLCFSGRVFNGHEAYEMGFATHLATEPREAALKAAHEIATKSPDAIRSVKRLLNSAHDNKWPEQLRDESIAQKQLMEGRNHLEAVRAATGKRDPIFEDVESDD